MPSFDAIPMNTRCGQCGARFGQHSGLNCPPPADPRLDGFVPSIYGDDTHDGPARLRDIDEYTRLVRAVDEYRAQLAVPAAPVAPSAPPAFIVGYTYDANVHCVYCASTAHARVYAIDGHDAYGIPRDAVDSEGNPVRPIFATDEAPDADEYCGRCMALVRRGRNMCECGDGCQRDDCPSCYEAEEPDYALDEDDDEDDNHDCDCENCLAAAAYRGEVE